MISKRMAIDMARMMVSQKRSQFKIVLRKEAIGTRMSMMTLKIQESLTSKSSISLKLKSKS